MGDLVTLLARLTPARAIRRAGAGPRAGGTTMRQRRGIDVLIDAFARTLGGWRPDPWPLGVQEEDRDRPWGRGAAAGEGARPEPPGPATKRVQSTVRWR